jgi:outer membrane biosynthesis protein TonB
MKQWIKKHPIGLAIAISILLHVVLLLLFGFSRQWMILQAAVATPQQESDPIVFDLTESPDELSEKPKDAKHISDRDFSARNPSAPAHLPIGETFSQGDLARGEFPTLRGSNQPQSATQRSASAQQKSPPQKNEGAGNLPSQEFRRELLVNNKQAATNGQPEPALQRPVYDNRLSRAPELGSFAINTYAWDYAPYLLWLKRRIEQNIYPPPAFTKMGMISGQTQLRFRIYPDGRLEALEVLQTVGHKSLMETSVKAVELSVPLKPLPADFPEPYLEITALFEYLVHGRR